MHHADDVGSLVAGFVVTFVYKVVEAGMMAELGKAFCLGMVGAAGGWIMKVLLVWTGKKIKTIIKSKNEKRKRNV